MPPRSPPSIKLKYLPWMPRLGVESVVVISPSARTSSLNLLNTLSHCTCAWVLAEIDSTSAAIAIVSILVFKMLFFCSLNNDRCKNTKKNHNIFISLHYKCMVSVFLCWNKFVYYWYWVKYLNICIFSRFLLKKRRIFAIFFWFLARFLPFFTA